MMGAIATDCCARVYNIGQDCLATTGNEAKIDLQYQPNRPKFLCCACTWRPAGALHEVGNQAPFRVNENRSETQPERFFSIRCENARRASTLRA
ncbi:hypothetical protein, partial [Acinetobacter baumannii]|uniref:hypothetical protein n=1 Tax=Acinetobacter baumannii TaxID=470 RepID=UPI0039EE84E5